MILRHTLMNPFLIDAENGISYIEAYFEFLDCQMERLLAQGAGGPAEPAVSGAA